MFLQSSPQGHAKHHVPFEEFFSQGAIDSFSPFLTPRSRLWGANLTLKAAVLAAILLGISFALSFYYPPLAYILLIGVYFLAGVPALIESIEDLSNFEINIDILMTVAAFASVLIGSGFEGALLLVLFALSGAMEDAVTLKAKSAISHLNQLSPTKATVVESDGTLIEKSVKEILPGTIILVKAGQLVPLDGMVISGSSSVNLVHLTGENFPVFKGVHHHVPAGARNLEGALTLAVTHTSSDSTLAKIIELVTQAQEAKPKLQRWFDALSRGYALTIIILSAIFALVFPYLFSMPFLGVGGSLYRALTFLIAASPCALIIAVPIAYLSAISACAKKGILLKGGITLDALASCSTIAFDKTGTLTTGDLSLISIDQLTEGTGTSVQLALSIAYALERNAIHPMAKAIMNYAQLKKSENSLLTNFRSIPGHGLEANYNGKDVAIGRPEFIANKTTSDRQLLLLRKVEMIKEKGELVSILLIDQTLYLLRFSDTTRKDMAAVVKSLHKKNYAILMLTGDHSHSAKRIADLLGIDKYYSDLKPQDKLSLVTELSKKGLAMVGDGINDAPALARATVGICMGKVGSTTAIDAADVVLLHDNIEWLDWLFEKAKQTQTIVKQNLLIAVGAILVAAIPALIGWVPLWLAVILHEGGTVLVGLNALRLLRS